MKHIKPYKKRVLLLHGYGTNAHSDFHPWLKSKLEDVGYIVELPNLPNPDEPLIEEQVEYVLEKYPTKKNMIIAHSLGCVTALKLIESLDYKIDDLILVSGFIDYNFYEGDEDIENLSGCCDWDFDFNRIKSSVGNIHILRPQIDTAVTPQQTESLSKKLGSPIHIFKQVEDHACGKTEPGILNYIKLNT